MKRSFTFIELSAAGCMVAMSLAVVLPMQRSVRQQDRLAGCLANLRAIGAASLTYAAEDPNQLFVPVADLSVLAQGSGAFEWGGKAGRGSSSQSGNITYSYWGTRNFRGPAHRPLNKTLYKGGLTDWNPPNGQPQPGPGGLNYINDANLDLDVYRCPADTGYAGGGFLYTATTNPIRDQRPFRDEGFTAYDHYGTSYAAIEFFISGGLAGSQLSSQSLYLTPLSRVPNPGRTLAYQEVPARFAWLWGSWSGSGCEWAGYEQRVEGGFNTIPGWHDQSFRFNVAFADGNAATIETRGSLRPPPNLGFGNYPSGLCGSSLSDYECLRCVTTRGADWQIDTIPARPILTPWFGARSVPQSVPGKHFPEQQLDVLPAQSVPTPRTLDARQGLSHANQ